MKDRITYKEAKKIMKEANLEFQKDFANKIGMTKEHMSLHFTEERTFSPRASRTIFMSFPRECQAVLAKTKVKRLKEKNHIRTSCEIYLGAGEVKNQIEEFLGQNVSRSTINKIINICRKTI